MNFMQVFFDNNWISTEKAKLEIYDFILDVRTKNEFNAGHYKGALNIPFDEINKTNTNYWKKEDKILVYCRSGTRARNATNTLMEFGFKNVHYITDSYDKLIS